MSISSREDRKDWSVWRRAQASIAHGALTNSKRPSCLVKGVYPTHLREGQGARVWDTNDKSYIDFICGLGSNILGYGHAEVANSISERARRGCTLSLGTELEVELAEKIKEVIPFIDLVRFLKTGSDACSAAVRVARSYTGRDLVLSDGYHGWHDGFVSLTPPALGVPKHPEWAKLDLTRLNEAAAVIIEPIMTDISDARIQYLHELRAACTKSGTVLIFDEVITGFRFPKLTVSNYYGVTPDLICLGKAMGNGMPISVVGGKKEIMECGEYFISSTFAGETLSIAAAMTTIRLLQSKYDMQHLWSQGGMFISKFNELYPEKIKIDGYPTRGTFQGDPLTKALFWQECCKAGILFGPSWFFNFEHIPLSAQVLNTCKDILTRIRVGAVTLEGEMPSSPFAAKVRGEK